MKRSETDLTCSAGFVSYWYAENVMKLIKILVVVSGCAFFALPGVAQAGEGKSTAVSRARLPAPVTPADAQIMFAGALAAERDGLHRQAALFLDAILRSDHLTDRGRADVYWLAAQTWDAAGDEARAADCWGGFLVAVSILDQRDANLNWRESKALTAWTGWRAKQNNLP